MRRPWVIFVSLAFLLYIFILIITSGCIGPPDRLEVFYSRTYGEAYPSYTSEGPATSFSSSGGDPDGSAVGLLLGFPILWHKDPLRHRPATQVVEHHHHYEPDDKHEVEGGDPALGADGPTAPLPDPAQHWYSSKRLWDNVQKALAAILVAYVSVRGGKASWKRYRDWSERRGGTSPPP